jgi:hypothetical protein
LALAVFLGHGKRSVIQQPAFEQAFEPSVPGGVAESGAVRDKVPAR